MIVSTCFARTASPVLVLLALCLLSLVHLSVGTLLEEASVEDESCPEAFPEDGESLQEALASFLQLGTQHHRGALGKASSEDAPRSDTQRPKLALESLEKTQASAPCEGFDCLKRFAGGPAGPEYEWNSTGETQEGTTNGVSWKGHLLEMTSQAFLTSNEVANPLWKHPLVVIVPDGSNSNSTTGSFATVFASFGDMKEGTALADTPPDDIRIATLIASQTRSPVAVLFQIPPGVEILALNESKAEDELLVWGHEQFLQGEGSSTQALVEFAMVRALRRAMDTVSAFLGDTSSAQGRKFALMGSSKRGHLTYHTAAVDDRVVAIVPISRPINQEAFAHRLSRCLGGMPWVGSIYVSPDYVKLLTPQHSTLLYGVLDPIHYLDRYENVNKLVIDATQDDFFLPDDTSLYWDVLPGPKTYRALPNERHVGGSAQIVPLAPTIATFLAAVALSSDLPEIEWTLDRTYGNISVSLKNGSMAPSAVKLWQARTCSASPRRDFRMITKDEGEACTRCGIPIEGMAACLNAAAAWKATSLDFSNGRDSWEVQLDVPKDGTWMAALVEFQFIVPGSSSPYVLSTEVLVVPDVFPYADVDNLEDANNTLVLATELSTLKAAKEAVALDEKKN